LFNYAELALKSFHQVRPWLYFWSFYKVSRERNQSISHARGGLYGTKILYHQFNWKLRFTRAAPPMSPRLRSFTVLWNTLTRNGKVLRRPLIDFH